MTRHREPEVLTSLEKQQNCNFFKTGAQEE